uniref:Uncharacterized protein n=1 Tax=Pyrodinium bahamense TaxID=73915 RepID=A0A7S0FA49_9DINO
MADTACALPSAGGPLRDYEDKLKAIDLCARGVEKVDIALSLGRSENWVKRWWKQDPQLISKPMVKHGPLVQNAPLQSFRDLEFHRAFACGPTEDEGEVSSLEELVASLAWEPARRATRCPETGKLRVRFDAAGRSLEQPGRFVTGYAGGVPRLDGLLRRVAATVGIRDPGSRVFLNRYETGNATCPVHRHDFWTAMVSFGADRVACIEERPMLLRNGDLLVFGTQSHGLPAMPDVGGRRVSVVVFFRPDACNIERRWLTVGDERNAEDADSTAAKSASTASTSSRLVDSDLCGCPGISLGLVARRGLQVQKPVVVFTIGCDLLAERVFFERAQCNEVSELWDVRCSMAGVAAHWEPKQLRRLCAVRMLAYHWVPLGRAEAGGIARHLASDEGRDVLARLVLSAAEGRKVAVLGHAEEWRDSERHAVASALASGDFGPLSVLHISACGVEPHIAGHAEPSAVPLAASCSTAERARNRFMRRCSGSS